MALRLKNWMKRGLELHEVTWMFRVGQHRAISVEAYLEMLTSPGVQDHEGVG